MEGTSEGPKTLGPFVVGLQQTRREQFAAWYGVAALFFVVLVPTTNATILAYFTADLKRDCGLTIAQYGLLTGYASGLVNAIASLVLGWGVDRYNWPRTYVLAAASLLLSGMYILEGMATNFGMLLAAVMVGSVGASVHLSLSVSVVSDLLPPQHVSIGQALIFTGEAVAVVLGGNVAYAFKVSGISWRAAPLGLAVASFCTCLAVGLGIREPPKGRFIIEPKEERKFELLPALAYLANMRTFWMLILGLGIRMNAGHLVLAYMPPYFDALYPTQPTLDATFATVVGVFAFISSIIIGFICERNLKKRPWMALYTGAIGGVGGCLFFMISLWSRKIAGDGGYALMLVCMALGALLANGATGPLAALTTLLLPPEFKSFALSVYEFLTGLLAPMYSVIIGVGLQAISSRTERQVGDNVQGAGPTSKLEAGEKTFKAAQILLAVGLLFAFVGSAAVFIPASWGVLSDIRKQQERAEGTSPPERLRLGRKVIMITAVVAVIVLVIFLLIISLAASFNPGGFRKHQG
ncbi:g3853 [Coccomyxa elongata]